LIASFIFSKWLDQSSDKMKNVLKILKIITFGSLVSFMMLLENLKPDNKLIITINVAFIGIFMVPLIPIGFYTAAELSRPVSEAMSSGVIILFGMIYAIIMICVVSAVCDH